MYCRRGKPTGDRPTADTRGAEEYAAAAITSLGAASIGSAVKPISGGAGMPPGLTYS